MCGEPVAKEDSTKDNQGRTYHKECFKCNKCRLTQTGKRVLEGENLVVGKNDCLIVKSSSGAIVLCWLPVQRSYL